MAFHNMLSTCVLIAALATGDCFFSNLMNEPLNFAVSLLDGQAHNEAIYPTTEYGPHTPGPITVTGNAGTTFTAQPGGHTNLKEVVANKLAAYIGGASKKSKVHHLQAIRHNSGISSKHSSSSTTHITAAPSSDESSSKTTWKHVQPAPKRPSKKSYNNQRIKASLSPGRRHSSHGRVNARHAPSKAGHKYRQSGWKQSSWGANRSSGSGEKYPVVTARQAKGVGSSSSEENVIILQKTPKSANKLRGSSKKYPVVNAKHASEGFGSSSSSSSEENIIIVHKTAKPANKLRRSSKNSGWKKNRWAANRSSGSGEKYPVVTAKHSKGVGSSSSSSEENIVIVHKTAKPVNKLRGSSKKSGWKKNSWASNRSSESVEKYPVVNAKHTKGIGSSSSSEEDVIRIENTAKPANKLRRSSKKSGWKKNRSSGSGEKYPVVNVKPTKGVGSSSSSSEENIIIVHRTAKPANKLRGSSKKSGWKKNTWASNRSSGSGEKYPVVNAKHTKGVGSSSSSEENVILIENTGKPAHSYRALKRQPYRGHSNRATGANKSKRRFSPKLQGAGLCNLCRG